MTILGSLSYMKNSAKKLKHICGRIDKTAERSDDLSDKAEELFLDMKESRSETEGVTCQGGHAK